MPEQLKKIVDRILAWWKKFNNKQRVLILSCIGVVLVSLIILCVVFNIPHPEELYTCSNYEEAAKVQELLKGENIEFSMSEDGLTFIVEEKDIANASILLGKNELPSKAYDISNVVTGSFTTTEADKQKLYKSFLEEKFKDHITQLDIVENCTIDITLPKNDGTILSREEEATAAVTLTLRKPMDSDQAYALARYIATQLGNETTDGITIIDSSSHVLYSGADANTIMGSNTTQLNFAAKLQDSKKKEIVDVLVDSKLFSDVSVAMNLSVDFDTKKITKSELGIPEGMDIGALTSISEYDAVTDGGHGGIPGTDSNDGDVPTYVTGEDGYTHSEVSESEKLYAYNEILTEIISSGGYIIHEDSSVAVVANKYVVYDEAELKLTGQLDDLSFEEFKVAHKEPKQIEVDDSFITLISNATGIPEGAISFMCVEQPKFIGIEEERRELADYAQIILTVLILLLLLYVVIRSTRSQKEQELEPELSVETLLESTAEANATLEDIGYNEKSEARVLIEKFVDENPEAVALLLRNWLNEDWE